MTGRIALVALCHCCCVEPLAPQSLLLCSLRSTGLLKTRRINNASMTLLPKRERADAWLARHQRESFETGLSFLPSPLGPCTLLLGDAKTMTLYTLAAKFVVSNQDRHVLLASSASLSIHALVTAVRTALLQRHGHYDDLLQDCLERIHVADDNNWMATLEGWRHYKGALLLWDDFGQLSEATRPEVLRHWQWLSLVGSVFAGTAPTTATATVRLQAGQAKTSDGMMYPYSIGQGGILS